MQEAKHNASKFKTVAYGCKMSKMYVIKRNGDVVEFEQSRIQNAILKAVRAIEAPITGEVVDKLVHEITKEITERFNDLHPNVENIQDIIERHLVKEGHYEIAKEYILYRDLRRREREAQRQQIVEKSIMGKLTVKKRDGRLVLFDMKRLRETIRRASKGFEKEINPELVIKEVQNNISHKKSPIKIWCISTMWLYLLFYAIFYAISSFYES